MPDGKKGHVGLCFAVLYALSSPAHISFLSSIPQHSTTALIIIRPKLFYQASLYIKVSVRNLFSGLVHHGSNSSSRWERHSASNHVQRSILGHQQLQSPQNFIASPTKGFVLSISQTTMRVKADDLAICLAHSPARRPC